ncbi:MAG: hypothetical protein A2Y60_04635 [Chloroflexi bacterium RBG_13_54_9]|nr:MAG: hypothetical protein A2Y60_04635 [Chloroflexi bacterium RBG_13_54_9]
MRERIQLTAHAREMLQERGIAMVWVERTLESPSQVENRDDGTVHYLSPIPAFGGRILRVVVNPEHDPPQVITVFFDRRMGRKT